MAHELLHDRVCRVVIQVREEQQLILRALVEHREDVHAEPNRIRLQTQNKHEWISGLQHKRACSADVASKTSETSAKTTTTTTKQKQRATPVDKGWDRGIRGWWRRGRQTQSRQHNFRGLENLKTNINTHKHNALRCLMGRRNIDVLEIIDLRAIITHICAIRACASKGTRNQPTDQTKPHDKAKKRKAKRKAPSASAPGPDAQGEAQAARAKREAARAKPQR